MKYQKWSPKEIEQLRQLYPVTLARELVSRLNHPESSIRAKAQQLKIKAKSIYHRPKHWPNFRENPFDKLSENECIYIAGIIDGEGSISFKKDKRCPKAGKRVEISIGNTSFELMHWLNKKLGFNLYSLKVKNNRKKAWMLQIANNIHSKQFLRRISPYLIVKKPLAYRALKSL